MKLTRNKKIIIIFLIILGLLKLISIYWIDSKENKVTSISDSQCDVYHACTLPNGVVVQAIGKNVNQPISIRLHYVPQNTTQVYISFSMKDMDMGFNRYKLFAQANKTNWYADRIRLPVCVQDRHDYLMDITMGNTSYQIPFTVQ